MSYPEIVRVVYNIITFILGLLYMHFLFYAIIGLFFKKSYPKTDKKNKFGLIIPARNEESVVTQLIESIQKNNYPQDKLHIFVIAHNCTDRTAEVARQFGVDVYEYNNPEENTMGYAFRYLFNCIERDYGTQNFDGFVLFNADNILDKDYFSRMNDAFEYYNKECVITSFRNSKNFGTNLISGLYGMYFTTGCRLESRGRTVVGCSTRVQGTGYLINSNLVKNGWKYVTLAEDWEFSADQVLRDNCIRFCDDAVFYDEQPTSLRIMWRQRVRWSRGHWIVCVTRLKDLIKRLFAKDTKHRVSVYDIMSNIMPLPAIYLILQVLYFLLLLLTPIVDRTLTLQQVFLGTAADRFGSNGVLYEFLRGIILSYATTFLSGLVVFISEHKRIMNVSFFKKVLIAILWPAFVWIQLFIDLQALFSKNLGWKPIPHNDHTTFDHVNKKDEEEKTEENN